MENKNNVANTINLADECTEKGEISNSQVINQEEFNMLLADNKSKEAELSTAMSSAEISKVEENRIYNEDCLTTMSKMGQQVDLILTSPPYNITRKGLFRYDVYDDSKSNDEYLDWTLDLFENFSKVVKKNGVILYNFSYSTKDPTLPYRLVSKIDKNTEWTLVDTIIWKKPSAMPFPANPRRLSRNWEFVFVLTRKTDVNTFACYKPITTTSAKTGQRYYQVTYNFIEAANNDGATSGLNQATFSSEMCMKLLNIYGFDGADGATTVYDPFMGTGTTAVACKLMNMNYIGSEISSNQCKYAERRLATNKSKFSVGTSDSDNFKAA